MREGGGGLARIPLDHLQDREFVAAEPCHDVGFPRARDQPLRHHLEQDVSHQVAEGIVDRFELVEVEQEDAEAVPALPQPRQRLVDLHHQHHAIGKVGQGVMVRHVLDARFRPLLLGLILHHAQDVARLPVRAADDAPARGHELHAALALIQRRLVIVVLAIDREQLVVACRDGIGRRLGQDVVRRLADDLVNRTAEELLARLVDENEAEIMGVLHDDGRRDVFDHGVEEVLGACDFLFGPALLGDVLVQRHPAAALHRTVQDGDHPAVGQFHRHGARLALGNLRTQLRDVALRVGPEGPHGFPLLEQFVQRGARLREVRREPIELQVALVAHHEAARLVEHAQAVRHVVERGVEAQILGLQRLARLLEPHPPPHAVARDEQDQQREQASDETIGAPPELNIGEDFMRRHSDRDDQGKILGPAISLQAPNAVTVLGIVVVPAERRRCVPLEQLRTGEIRADQIGRRSTHRADDAVQAHDADECVAPDVDRLIELGEVLRIERCRDDAVERAIRFAQRAREMDAELLGSAADHRLADDELVGAGLGEVTEVRPIADVDDRKHRTDAAHEDIAVAPDDDDLHGRMIGNVRGLQETREIERCAVALVAGAQDEQRAVDVLQGAREMLLEGAGEIARGLHRGPLGVLPLGGEVEVQAEPDQTDDHQADIGRALPEHGSQQSDPILFVGLQHWSCAPIRPWLYRDAVSVWLLAKRETDPSLIFRCTAVQTKHTFRLCNFC